MSKKKFFFATKSKTTLPEFTIEGTDPGYPAAIQADSGDRQLEAVLLSGLRQVAEQRIRVIVSDSVQISSRKKCKEVDTLFSYLVF